ncbi:hypothetical protein [Streptomyces platensis]|uniref:hypothetical protein n=1 Tax=Streptomyces platensis TaxID=58346 RepID=UPI0038676D32|nr:hypothetical protein OG962_36945 [Streptomyces platensis]
MLLGSRWRTVLWTQWSHTSDRKAGGHTPLDKEKILVGFDLTFNGDGDVARVQSLYTP